MKKHIKLLSLAFAVVMLSLCFVSCGGIEDNEKSLLDNEKSLLDLAEKNTLQEGKKYFFESAEYMLDIPFYHEVRDNLTQEQYDAFKELLEAKCQEKLQRSIEGMYIYTIAEDGSYDKHISNYYIFEDGNIYVVDLIGVGYHEESDAYDGYIDQWDEYGGAEYYNPIGTYDENTINIYENDVNADDFKATMYNGELLIKEESEVSAYFDEYTVYFTYHYKIAD